LDVALRNVDYGKLPMSKVQNHSTPVFRILPIVNFLHSAIRILDTAQNAVRTPPGTVSIAFASQY